MPFTGRPFWVGRDSRNQYAAFVAGSVSRLSRIAGLALGAGGALTLALGAATFFLLPLIAPFAALEAVVGIRVIAGRLGAAWLAIPGSAIGLCLGIGTIDGFAGPIAVASAVVNGIALVVTTTVGLREPDVPESRSPGSRGA